VDQLTQAFAKFIGFLGKTSYPYKQKGCAAGLSILQKGMWRIQFCVGETMDFA